MKNSLCSDLQFNSAPVCDGIPCRHGIRLEADELYNSDTGQLMGVIDHVEAKPDGVREIHYTMKSANRFLDGTKRTLIYRVSTLGPTEPPIADTK